MNFYIAQIIGLVGIVLMFFSYQHNDKKKILWIQAFAGAVWALHYIFLGKLTGMGMNLLEIPRDLIFGYRHEKKRQRILTVSFSAAFILVGILTWENGFSAFPVCGMCVSTFVFGLRNLRNIRLFSLAASALWLVYNILVFSVAGIFTEIFCLFSIFVAIYRFDIKKG